MVNEFIQISLLVIIVLCISFIMRLLKQPLIIGYIFSGIIAGPFFLNILADNKTILSFSEIGIALLLFMVGLHLSPKVLKEVGKISFITGIGQILFTSGIGFFICRLLGFSIVHSIYISIALTFSSTIIIMKLLSDKDALEKLYGKISIGFLLVQDFVAILILIIVSSLSSGGNATTLITNTLIKGVAIIIFLVPVSIYILPRLSDFFAKSQEILFLFAIAWGFGLSSLFHYIGFSVEIGALIAGVMLSISPYSYEISSKLKPLRDFFIISFFLLLGAQMSFGDISNLWFPIIALSTFILIGNPLIVIILMGYFGYSKRTGFMAGLTVAQISEFSLILIALGVKVGHLSGEILSFVTIIGLTTIAGSTYMITYSDKIYPYISKYLSLFERKKTKEEIKTTKDYNYYLLGENRIGFSLMKSFMKNKKDYLVIDFNPVRVKKLKKRGISCVYGDVSNSEFIDEIKLNKAKLIVSTIPETETNIMLLKIIKKRNKDVVMIVTARQISETFRLYEEGADYVILPHFLGGEYTAKLIEEVGINKKGYVLEKEKQIQELKERLAEGQEHPKKDVESHL
jgi:Kef-type K+ transport system membrane component KefB/Trk K+ transport system NAD-binding subunit